MQSQWWGKSQTIQPNLITLSGIHDHLWTLTKKSNTLKGDVIIRRVPVKYRGKSESALKPIEWEPTMHSKKYEEFVYSGQVIRGSNIVDLVNDVMRYWKDFHSHYWQKFAHALHHNVPQELVGNQRRWDWMHPDPATLDAYSMPEEGSPKRTLRSWPRCQTSARRWWLV